MNTTLQPKVLEWARVRASLGVADLAKKIRAPIDAVLEWEQTGEIDFTKAQLLAEKTHTPFGFLFLSEPPVETLPVSDFRTVGSQTAKTPSPELLDVFHHAQRRQNWYRNFQLNNAGAPLEFVGRAKKTHSPVATAEDIRKTIQFDQLHNEGTKNWDDAMRHIVDSIESAGILFLRTGVAEGNTHRKLLVSEFRGFALADRYAPLIFINGADSKSAQMFTIAHEIAHIWLGESAVSNLDKTDSSSHKIERFCNEVAAEVLLPLLILKREWRKSAPINNEISRVADKYKVSRIVVARRARDAGFISYPKYSALYDIEVAKSTAGSGGNYYLNQQYQNSRRFSVALLRDTREGKTLYHDAMDLLGIRKSETLKKYAETFQIRM